MINIILLVLIIFVVALFTITLKQAKGLDELKKEVEGSSWDEELKKDLEMYFNDSRPYYFPVRLDQLEGTVEKHSVGCEDFRVTKNQVQANTHAVRQLAFELGYDMSIELDLDRNNFKVTLAEQTQAQKSLIHEIKIKQNQLKESEDKHGREQTQLDTLKKELVNRQNYNIQWKKEND